MRRAMFFVDGFNLYHAIAAKAQFRKYKWLNLRQLCSSILSSQEQLIKIFFFTAYYPGDAGRRQRHQTYIRALELHDVEIVIGEFKRKDKYCQHCKKTFTGYEEKQTDVNIAIELFRQAVQDTYDTAFILSGDSDLVPALRAVKKTFPNKTLKLVLPPERQSESMKQEVAWFMRMKERHLAKNQFPAAIEKNSVRIEKPKEW
jgi:uncharacterized LabA/DUF88 family protein